MHHWGQVFAFVSRRIGFSRHSSKSQKNVVFNDALNSLRGLDCSRFFTRVITLQPLISYFAVYYVI